MEVHTYEHAESGVVVLALRGQLALDTAAKFREVLKDLLTRSATAIVIDLGEVDFCDSLGLSAVLDAHRACVERGGWVRLAAPAAGVARVLHVVGVSGLVPVFDSVQAATAGAPGDEPDPPPSAGRQ